ncbi:MAG TPA: hypothetical protein VFJ74_11365 [Gemmatimonadaceae bacterium]|nr:hypothetical protein [Gemmatimonadaceae bacterium]
MLTSAAGAWLLQQAATLPDTIITKQVAQPRDWLNTISAVASILISLALLALCVGLIPAAWNFRKSYGKVNDLLEKVYGDVNPIMRHASTIADNVNYVTTSIRVDVQQVNQTIATANERLQEAMRLTERRVREFNALMDVVQREAEGTFVATAATLRGVREGAATFRDDALGVRRDRYADAGSGGGGERGGPGFRDALAERLAELRAEAALNTERYTDVYAALDDERDDDEFDEEMGHEDVFAGAPEDDLGDRVGDEQDEDLYEAGAEGMTDADASDNADDTRGSSDGYRRGVPPVGGGAERPRIRTRGGRQQRGEGGSAAPGSEERGPV